MSFAISNHKSNRNGYIERVKFTSPLAVTFVFETCQLDQKCFIYERDLKIAHSKMAETRKAGQH